MHQLLARQKKRFCALQSLNHSHCDDFRVIQQFSQSGLFYHLPPDKQKQNKVRFNLHYPLQKYSLPAPLVIPIFCRTGFPKFIYIYWHVTVLESFQLNVMSVLSLTNPQSGHVFPLIWHLSGDLKQSSSVETEYLLFKKWLKYMLMHMPRSS